jgi:FkbM family methyltransferase
MSLAARVLRRTGSTALGPPLVRLVAGLAQRQILGFGPACRAVEALVSDTSRPLTTVLRVDLDGHSCQLELDLSIPSCRSLFIQPEFQRAADWPSIRLFCELAREATTIIDVGANFGIYTYFAATHARQSRLIAYEPAPRVAALFERNLARNGWTERVDVRRAGVSANAGSMTFYVRENDHESTFEPDLATVDDVRDRIQVPIVALDDVFEREAIDPSRALLKIDVEGHEMRVLDGLERTLRQSQGRPTLLMEFLGKAIVEDRILDRVVGFGLQVYYVTPTALVRVGSTSDLERVHQLGQSNFLVTERAVA